MTRIQFCTRILRDAYWTALAAFILFFFLDLAKKGFVTHYININVVFLSVLVLGACTVLFPPASSAGGPRHGV